MPAARIAPPAPGYEEYAAPEQTFNRSVIPSPAEERAIRRANESEKFLLSLFQKDMMIDSAPLRRANKSTSPELKEAAKEMLDDVMTLRMKVEIFKAELDQYQISELEQQHEATRLACREAKEAYGEVVPEIARAQQMLREADSQVQTLTNAYNALKSNPPRAADFPSKDEIAEHRAVVQQAKDMLDSAVSHKQHWDNELISLGNKKYHLGERFNDLTSEFKTQRKHLAALRGEPLTVGKESSFKAPNEFGIG